MNNSQVNINSLTPQEARLYRLYGRIPSQSHHFAKHLKERKYFDSGDYALSKAGRADSAVGSQHPVPQNIPHPHLRPLNSTTQLPLTGSGSLSRSGSFSDEGGSGVGVGMMGMSSSPVEGVEKNGMKGGVGGIDWTR